MQAAKNAIIIKTRLSTICCDIFFRMLLFKKDPPGTVVFFFRLSDIAKKSNIF